MTSYSLKEIPDDVWAEYKDTIQKSKRIDDDIIDLIKEAIQKRKDNG